VWFAGELKRTTSMPAKRGAVAVDQELEWVIDGSKVRDRGRKVEVEVWDTHWRDGGWRQRATMGTAASSARARYSKQQNR
jgi:hypothetical protein